jgi:excisionase family DNA binding protein
MKERKTNSDAALRLAKLMNMKDTCEYLGVSKPTIYRWIKDPVMNFPKPVHIGARVGWKKGDIDHWLKVLSA